MKEIFDIFAPYKLQTNKKEETMKRIFIMLACVTLLAACGENKKEEKKQLIEAELKLVAKLRLKKNLKKEN